MRGATNTRRLTNKLTRAIPRHVKRAAQDEAEKQGAKLVREMKRLVPVDEGDLKASIRQRDLDGAIGVAVIAGDNSTEVTNADGTHHNVALIQEFGRKGEPAQPYFWTSVRKRKRPIKNGLNRAVRKAIKDGAK